MGLDMIQTATTAPGGMVFSGSAVGMEATLERGLQAYLREMEAAHRDGREGNRADKVAEAFGDYVSHGAPIAVRLNQPVATKGDVPAGYRHVSPKVHMRVNVNDGETERIIVDVIQTIQPHAVMA